MLTKRSIAAVFAAALIFAACSSGTASVAPSVAAPSSAASAAASAPASAPASAAASQGASGFAACGSENNGSGLKVGGVTDVGHLDDKSFNEAGWCGTLKGATAIGGSARVVVTKQPSDYAANIQTLVDAGFQVIVTYGFNLTKETTIAAKKYPDVRFIGIDQFICINPDGTPDTQKVTTCAGKPDVVLPNYQGLNFNEAQAGYLAGVVAGSISKTKTIGSIGGIKTVPPIPQYMGGYENGALFANPSVKVLPQTFVSTDITKAFNLPDVGRTIANQMIDAGADVIFQVAGGSGVGALEAVCAKNLYGIGVDIDQHQSAPTVSKCIVTSAEKKLVDSTAAAIQRVANKLDKGGNIFLDAKADPPGIGLSPFYGFQDLITPEITAKIKTAFDAMKAGTLDPCKGPGKCFFDPDK